MPPVVGDKSEIGIGKPGVENVERRMSKMENKGLLSENKHTDTEGRGTILLDNRRADWMVWYINPDDRAFPAFERIFGLRGRILLIRGLIAHIFGVWPICQINSDNH